MKITNSQIKVCLACAGHDSLICNDTHDSDSDDDPLIADSESDNEEESNLHEEDTHKDALGSEIPTSAWSGYLFFMFHVSCSHFP